MAGLGALDTPRTNLGDATFLSRQPDFDMSQEISFQSPSKDKNIFQQLKNGGRPNLQTPRGGGGKRAPFSERRNLPSGIGGPEFTPLLKSATRRSARRHSGKENGLATPAFLDKIDEDLTPLPNMNESVYGTSRNNSTFLGRTPIPQADSDSTVSTPMVMKTRRETKGSKGPLQDGNQLSLREQEQVIDRIEKENFGLKLKIHFLEEALRKAGPGFSEAALKENTDLKVDKVTMQRDLQRYKKHLTTAEKELENYRQQVLEMQDKAKKRYADEGLRKELERMKQILEDKEADIEELQRLAKQDEKEHDKVEKLQDEIADLEADNREKDRIIVQQEDDLEDLRLKVQAAEDRTKDSQRRMLELEEKAQASSKLEEAKETIEDLEASVRQLESQVEDMRESLQDAVDEKNRAENDLEELQEEMANKSVVTKGLSRQVEEKVARLQDEVEDARERYASLEKRHGAKEQEVEDLKLKLKDSRQERDTIDRERRSLSLKVEELQGDLRSTNDQKSLLQARHDALTNESASLQRDFPRLQREVSTLEATLEQERQYALQNDRNARDQSRGEVGRLKAEIADLQSLSREREDEQQSHLQRERTARDQLKTEIDRLKDQISDLQAEIREKENLYDNDSEKWETELHNLEAERDRAEEKAAGLQRTIDKLRQVEGALSNKELKLKEALDSEIERHKSEEAVLCRQIDELRHDLEARQAMLEALRKELAAVRDHLRLAQLDHQAEAEKVESLEDEVEVLQTALDEETESANEESQRAKRTIEDLEQQLRSLQAAVDDSARKSTSVSQEVAKRNAEHLERLKTQLTETTFKFTKVTKEKQTLQDQLASVNIELHSVRASLAETKAERSQLEGELLLVKQHGDDTFRLDQERVDLRASRTRLDAEVRRLKEENRSLMARLHEVEAELRLAKQQGEQTIRLDQEWGDLLAAKAKIDSDLRRLKEENMLLVAERTEMEHELRVAKQQGSQSLRLDQERSELVASKVKLESELRRLKEENVLLAAEREDIEDELRLAKQRGDDTFQFDQERINLRAAKTKLDSEVRRLREENRLISEQRAELERRLEEEIDKAAAEEDRLAHEIMQLQVMMRQSADGKDSAATRRTIRGLERRVEEYEAQLAVTTNLAPGNIEGNSDMSILRRDLSTARSRERDFAQREAAHKATVRDLKRQISDLERLLHDAEVSRLMKSPTGPETPAARKSEINGLRHQLVLAHQVGHDLKKALRGAEREVEVVREELQARISELEDQAASLEQQLDDARAAADEAAAASKAALDRYKGKSERYRRERDELAAALAEAAQTTTQQSNNKDNGSDNNSTAHTDVSKEERRDLHNMLRRAQIDADGLEREVREHKAAVEVLTRTQESLRGKLERVRLERATYKASAEGLRREVEVLGQAGRELEVVREGLEVAREELELAREEVEQARGEADANALLAAERERETREAREEAARLARDREQAATEPGEVTLQLPPPTGAVNNHELDNDHDLGDDTTTVDLGQLRLLVHKVERQKERHQGELYSLARHIEWMQARFEREARFRADAVTSKRFLQKKMSLATACNKADADLLIDILKSMRRENTEEMCIPATEVAEKRLGLHGAGSGGGKGKAATTTTTATLPPASPRRRLRRAVLAVLFAVRARRMAGAWAVHERMRRRLLDAVEREVASSSSAAAAAASRDGCGRTTWQQQQQQAQHRGTTRTTTRTRTREEVFLVEVGRGPAFAEKKKGEKAAKGKEEVVVESRGAREKPAAADKAKERREAEREREPQRNNAAAKRRAVREHIFAAGAGAGDTVTSGISSGFSSGISDF